MVASVCVECGKPCSGVRCRECYRRSVGATSRVDRVCAHCGVVFRRPLNLSAKKGVPRDSGKYCGSKCYHAARRSGTQQSCGVPPAEVRRKRAAAFLVRWEKAWKRMLRKRPCEQCGRDTKNPRFCCEACMFQWRGVVTCKCGTIIEHATWRTNRCLQCVSKNKQALKRKYPKNYRSRCRKGGGHYNAQCKRVDVFERDGYVCHVCQRKTLSRARIVFLGLSRNHPRAATVDHFPVPLSKGGDHDWDNVRCACRKCNVERGARWDCQKRLRFTT